MKQLREEAAPVMARFMEAEVLRTQIQVGRCGKNRRISGKCLMIFIARKLVNIMLGMYHEGKQRSVGLADSRSAVKTWCG